MFSFVRCAMIKDVHYLEAMSRHARRQDSTSLERVDRSRTHLNMMSSGYTDDPTDMRAAFKERKARSGAKEYGKASLGLHMLVGVSPEWVARQGDIHDPTNPANVKLFREAQAFVEKEFGQGSVITARMDMDEAGGAVVDVFCVPVREMKMRGKRKDIISVNKALDEVRGRYAHKGQVGAFKSVQDAWHAHATMTMDPALKRGTSKDETGRVHLKTEVFKDVMQEITAGRNEIAQLPAQRQEIAEKRQENAEISVRIDKIIETVTQRQEALQTRQQEIVTKEKKIAKEQRKIKKEREELENSARWWTRTGQGLMSMITSFKSLKGALLKSFQEGRKEGEESRQSEVDIANSRVKRLEKERDDAVEELRQEKASRAKDHVLPAREHAEYAIWKTQQITKNAVSKGRNNERNMR